MHYQTKNPKYPDFNSLFKQPPLLRSKEFSVWIGDNSLNLTRFKVVVLKKNIKMAVARNRAKRLSKEIFNRYRLSFVGKDIILVIKRFELKINLPTWKSKLEGAYSCLSHFAHT